MLFEGCCNKVPQPGWLKEQKFTFPQLGKLEAWGQGVSESFFLRPLPSACRCLLPVSARGSPFARVCVPVSSYRDKSYWIRAKSSNFFFNLISSLFYCLFLAVPGLCCSVKVFYSSGKWGLLSCCSVQASHCGGFSCCRAWFQSAGFSLWWLLMLQSMVLEFRLLTVVASHVAEHGSRVQASHSGGFSCCRAWFQSTGFSLLWLLMLQSMVLGCRLLTVVASHVAERGSRAQAQQLGLSCLSACRIFPELGLNPGPLHWRADWTPGKSNSLVF